MNATRTAPYQRFLKRLRTARLEAGMTQVEVARALKRTQNFVSKSESGDRRVDVIELHYFARLYGKPVSFFVSARPTACFRSS